MVDEYLGYLPDFLEKFPSTLVLEFSRKDVGNETGFPLILSIPRMTITSEKKKTLT